MTMPVSETTENNSSEEVQKTGWVRATLIFLATITLAIGISIVLYLFRDKVEQLGNYGYLGAFLISLVTSATVVFPVPGIVLLVVLADTLNPVFLSLAGATGAIIGEMTGFMVGFGGKKVIRGRSRFYLKMERWMRRWGAWGVFFFAAVPLPLFDVAGMISGALGFPLWKFMLIGWAGKIIKVNILVFAGAWGWDALLKFIGSGPPAVP